MGLNVIQVERELEDRLRSRAREALGPDASEAEAKALGVCAAGNFRPNMKGVVQFMTTTYSVRSSPKSFHGADS